MSKLATFALLGVLGTLPCVGQMSPGDSQTLKDLLSEVRSLHNDVRLSQTTQILLTEMEMQQGVVTRAMQKRDDARSRLSQIQAQQKNMTDQMARFEDRASTTIDPTQKKQLADMQDNFKTNLVNLKSQEQDRSNELLDAEGALKKEQENLAAIQGQLDDVVRKLQPVNSK